MSRVAPGRVATPLQTGRHISGPRTDGPLLSTWLFEPHPLFVPLHLLPGPVSREETKHLTQNLLTI